MDVIKPKIQTDSPREDFNPTLPPSSIEMNMIPLRSFFQVQNPDHTEQGQLDFIYKFFDGKVDSMTEVMMELSELRNQLGTAPLGMTTLSQVYSYLRVLSQIGQLEKIQKGMIHG